MVVNSNALNTNFGIIFLILLSSVHDSADKVFREWIPLINLYLPRIVTRL